MNSVYTFKKMNRNEVYFLKKNILKEACILPPRTTDNTATDSQVKNCIMVTCKNKMVKRCSLLTSTSKPLNKMYIITQSDV